jgi:hypothetical protein
VIWDVLVIHWLAFGPSEEAEKELERSALASRRLSRTGPESSVPSVANSETKLNPGPKTYTGDMEKDMQIGTLKFLPEPSGRVDSGAESSSRSPMR